MTAANQRVTRADQAGQGRGAGPAVAHPAVMARVVMWTVVLANVAIVEMMFFASEPSKNALVAIGKVLGCTLP
ncbi:MAG: hypothetical protein QOE61_4796 [Micromonosporaceae bacterium]|jgi:hypothetical protein|nr:hypothetical protein [Micromonosporaceae bacterium]